MLLAKDQKALPSSNRPVIPRRLTPEEIRQKELLQMVSQANNQILIRKNSTTENSTNDGIDDVNVVPLGSKKVSLGDIEENKIEKQGIFSGICLEPTKKFRRILGGRLFGS